MKKQAIFTKTFIALCMAFCLSLPRVQAGQQIRCLTAGEKTGKDTIHVLLIGQDNRQGVQGKRSDSMILCSYSPGQKALILTSIMRDLYVKIPGYGCNRINAAYAFGGGELLKQTVEENFKLPIAGTIEVDFDQFPRVIDLLGGVTLDLRPDEAGEINRLVPWQKAEPGQQTLTGDQALVYSRIRKLDADSDFSRTRRQRALLTSILEQYREITLPQALELLTQMLPMVDTSLTPWQVMTYSSQVLPSFREMKITSQRIPAPGDGTEKNVDGMSVIVPDLQKVRDMLKKTLL